jgi:hypothetical protein
MKSGKRKIGHTVTIVLLTRHDHPSHLLHRNYLQCLLYLSDFEELRIIQKITDFQKCEKEALARSLWVNHNSEPKV